MVNVIQASVVGAAGRWLSLGGCCLLLLGGCVAQKQSISPYEGRAQRQAAIQREGVEIAPLRVEEKEPGAVVPVQELLMPTLTLINDRIYAYEQRLERLQALQQQAANRPRSQELLNTLSACRVQLQEILVGYNALHRRLLDKEELQAAQLLAADSLLSLSEQDFRYLEGDCNQDLTTAPPAQSLERVQVSTLHAEEEQLKKHYDQGEYAQVISRYEQLPLEEGQSPAFTTTFLYGQALLKSRREAEARPVFGNLLATIRKQDQAQWEFRLIQLIGDLEFGLEIYDSARARYREMAEIYSRLAVKNGWADQQLSALERQSYQGEEVKGYAALLRSYLGYNPDRDGYGVVQQAQQYIEQYPYSPVASNVDVLLKLARKEADQWLEKLLAKIDTLAGGKEYQEALLMIERVPRGILPLDKQELLRRKSEQLLTSESIAIETDRLVQEQELQEDWNQGMTLLEAREYDQAIEVFTTLLASPYEGKARVRIDEAARLAAVEDRGRAAELFVRANRTGDPAGKAKLLFASRKLLQDILVKYPQAGLDEKVRRNLVRINEEIESLDPTLLTAPLTVGNDASLEGGLPVELVPSAGDEANN
ncbi:hypothetical protein [Desulfogranum mediterraneum]|uniref:hypothetical protein n=1 Tax=Desulfogranum mediterraneum TaxID=160661 RepID=UPI0004294E2E|nr:hypothetical protein [Desulfogranum mediterraneum]